MGDADVARRHMDAFNKLWGLHLTYRFAAGPEMARQGNQLFTEFSAGQPSSSDILFSSAQSLAPLLPHDMFYVVPWTSLARDHKITPAFIEGNGRIIRTGTSVPVVVYNPTLMPHPPTTIQGLLTPQWTGKLATPHNASGFDVLSANDFWGQAKALDAVRKLVSLQAGLVRCGDDDRIASGEYGVRRGLLEPRPAHPQGEGRAGQLLHSQRRRADPLLLSSDSEEHAPPQCRGAICALHVESARPGYFLRCDAHG